MSTRAPFQELAGELVAFREFGCGTELTELQTASGRRIPVFTNEFWTRRQRAANPLHEISYRACYKPQLPRFFIERLTSEKETVYDPFMGRGTTLLEAALLGRKPSGNDASPLGVALVRPRLTPPSLTRVAERLAEIDFAAPVETRDDLLVFYHPDTLRELCALRHYLAVRRSDGDFDAVDDWIQMVALNRLTGHSPGFFSVYTLPPNQAVTVESQQRINARLNQQPSRRSVPKLILAKTKKLLSGMDEATRVGLAESVQESRLLVRPAHDTPELPDASISLVVTSPPFLNVVDYATDNWLRCWFASVDARSVSLSMHRSAEDWQADMTRVFGELFRVVRPGGHIAFEVGEINGGKLKLEELVLPCGQAAGLEPVLVLVNQQAFTKTANCWGVTNNSKGTNSNRVVLFRRD